ncbi:hypothetical protein ACET3Z_028423 [Daucus carota]
MNRETQEFWGINMLLIDDSNNRIHAFANAKLCDDRFKTLKEGDIYILKNFKVKDYLGDETYRAARTKQHVFFTSHTEFLKDVTKGLQIEKYAFDLIDLGQIEKFADDKWFLIDMVGKVENVQELIKSNKDDDDKTRFKFDISDGSYTVKVTFFDMFGQHVENELSKFPKDSTFVIISCARVGRYEGIPHLSNYPATRIFINPDHHSVKDLRKSWGTKNKVEIRSSIVTETTTMTNTPPIKILTVKDIRNLNADFKEDSAYCQVVAKRFSDQNSWYFRKCTGCDLELENVAGKFVCSQKQGCGRTIPYPDKRFRVCIFCSDQSGTLAIIFQDYEINRIIDKTVIDLQADCADEKDEDKFPEILNTLLKKKYTIKVYINKENLTKGSTIYEAKEIIQEVEKVGTHDPNPVISVGMVAPEMDEITEVEGITNKTPDTEKSTNMKIRARKQMEPVEFNTENISAQKPLKNVKIEKP